MRRVVLAGLLFVSLFVSALATEPVVAVHFSELTQSLEAVVAHAPTPTGTGTTGFEWWTPWWHYFVMPDSLKEALRSDGTAFVVVSDADISAGNLLGPDGKPRYPIVISLASEAIRDDEISQFRAYVAAGGFLLVGSASFTRNPDGTSRGDFALASEMGLHSATAGLNNWNLSSDFSKVGDHRLVSHIPSGTLLWRMPTTAEDISWGISPDHVRPDKHYFWHVSAGDATVIASSNSSPYLMSKSYGLGTFIYHAGMQPLIGNGGPAPGMYAYGIFRNAIEWAFEAAGLPLIRVSPWPYPYNAAYAMRHDYENQQWEIANIGESANIEHSFGAKGDYYFCTGTLRDEMGNLQAAVDSMRAAVSQYGATVGPHNGGLKNPNNLTLSMSEYDYWHWGPDEALDVVPAGYASGSDYARASLSLAFADIDRWLAGLVVNKRTWVSPYFNCTRDGSNQILEQLGVNTGGEQKLSPFPHWTVSTQTQGKIFNVVTLPVSDWYINSDVAQTMDERHNTSTIHSLVDYYYNLGAFINLYTHFASISGNPYEYLSYCSTKPAMWATNAVGIHDWWVSRSPVQIVSSCNPSGNNLVTTISVTGATDPDTAVELSIPNWTLASGDLQVRINGQLVGAESYRPYHQGLKIKVGPTTSTIEVSYPDYGLIAHNDAYSVPQSTTLNIAAPGVLSNDVVRGGLGLTAVLASQPAHGSLTLQSDGSFSYAPVVGFYGLDSFTYQASASSQLSNIVTVTITVPLTAVSTVVVNPASVLGGISSTGTVTLSDPAPGGGAVVALVSSNAAVAQVPASVTVAEGATTATFTVTTSPVFVIAQPTITASYGSTNGTATMIVMPAAGPVLFTDDFSGPAGPDPLWVTVQGTWRLNNGVMTGSSEASPGGFSHAYVNANWVDYSVQGRFQYSPWPIYGGLSGRLNAATGARYSAWIYPEPSWQGGREAYIGLVKFHSWESSNGFMQRVNLPNVGTGVHSLMMTFQGNRIQVYYDGNKVIDVTDDGFDSLPAYSSGGISLDMWSDDTSHLLSIDDILAANLYSLPIAQNDAYTLVESTTLNIAAPGVLSNDMYSEGPGLTSALVSGPAHGILTLQSDGSFSYTPVTGYIGSDSFTYQASSGGLSSNTATVTLTMVPPTCTLAYLAGTGGTVSGTTPQTVNYGGSGTPVTAVPDAHYHFVQWSDGNLSATRTDTNVTVGFTVTANFALDTFTLAYAGGENGTIAGTTPQTVNYGASGTPVTAVPNTGFRFVAWSDGVLTASRTDANVHANLSVSANFTIETLTLAYAAGENGTITGTTPQTVNYGASGTPVTAVPNAGFSFVAWSDGVLTASRTDANVHANLSVTANFAITTYTLTYTPGTGGTITGTTPQTVNRGGSGSPVTAVPGVGHHFVDWSDGNPSATRTDTNITADFTATANFAPDTFTLTYAAGENGTISGTTPQTVNYGASGTPVTAVPNAGYHFVAWSDSNTSATRTDANVTANLNLTASFALDTFTISGRVTVDSFGLAGVTMSGLPGPPVTGADGSYTATVDYGSTVTVTPTKASCTFDPASKIYANVTSNMTAQNYSASVISTPQRRALVALYNSTNGDGWANNTGWKTGPLYADGFAMPGTEGTWFGITINPETQLVTQINLDTNNLTGTLPASLGNLTSLTQLFLGHNDNLSGTIPSELGNLTNLRSLRINWCQVTGTIPAELGNLTYLQELFLQHNYLSGPLPPSLASLTNLQYLYLQYNLLSGSVPSWIGNFSGLLYLDLRENQFSGTIPPELGNLSNLLEISLSSNQISGTIPPELGNIHGLIWLRLSNNQLSGTIPQELGNLTNLYYLLIYGNLLSGTIPASLANLTHLLPVWDETDLGHNALHASDEALLTFLSVKDPDWAATQTVAPTSVTATSLDNAIILVSWLPIAYSGDTGYYKVLYSENQGGPYTLAGQTTNKTTSSVQVTGLTPGHRYYFVVQTHSDPVTSPSFWNLNAVESEYSTEVSAVAWLTAHVQVAGTVTAGGLPLAGVVMNGLTGSPVTNASGVYNGTEVAGWSGTVTPTLAGYTFNPVSRPYANLATDQLAQDYTAAPAINVAPVLAGAGNALNYAENQAATPICTTITVNDPDDTTLETAAVAIVSNYVNGQDILAFTNTAKITGTWATSTGSLTLTRVGGQTPTLAEWQSALRSVTYFNSSENPSTSIRTVSFIANDGDANSNVVTSTIAVTPQNDAPVLAGAGNTLGYAENQAATPVCTSLTVTDPDDTTLEAAAVVIATNYANGQDILGFTNTAKITGSWTTGTGTLMLTRVGGQTPTLAEWQSALRSVTYFNSSENPSTSIRTVSFIANDGDANSNVVASTITFTVANDPPVLAGAGNTLNYAENQAATPICTTITVVDPDDTTLETAAVTIVGNYAMEDVLAFADTGKIAGAWTTLPGRITLTRVAGQTPTLTEWQNALRSVTYVNTNENPWTSDRTVSFVANDGDANSNVVLSTITVTAVNDAPVITEGAGPVAVSSDEDNSPTGFALTLHATDGDNDTLTWSISTPASHGTATATGTGTSKAIGYTPAANWNGSDSFVVEVSDGKGGTDTITVNVTVSPRNDPPNNTALPSVSGTFHVGSTLTANRGTWNDSTDLTPGTLTYTFQWQRADDGAGTGAVDIDGATASTFTPTATEYEKYLRVRVTATDNGEGLPATESTTVNTAWTRVANTAPVLAGAGNTLNYAENQAATPICTTITVVDPDDTTLETAAVTIVGNYAMEDVLAFADTGKIAGAWTTLPGRITLTRVAGQTPTLTEWQNALRSVTYVNTNENPWTSDRTVSFVANDGDANSNVVLSTITVTAVNDAPVITEGAGPVAVSSDEDNSPTGFALTLHATDGDNDTLTWSISTPASHGTATATGTGTSKAIGYTPAANWNGSDSFVVEVSDGKGGTDTITVNVTISAQNDAPVNIVPVNQTINEDTDLVFSSGTGNPISTADVDVDETLVPNNELQIALGVGHGKLTLSRTTGLTFTSGGNNTASMTIRGNLTNINAALNGMIYRADADYFGSDMLTVGTSDLGHTGAGGVMTDMDSVAITVLDTTAPTVANVSSTTPDGYYKAGGAISIQIAFSEAVTVTGAPTLTLETGTSDAAAAYVSGSGAATLTFLYTILAGHSSADLDYVSTSALSLNGGTIKDAAGNDATLTLPAPGAAGSLGANKAIVIDTTAPAAPAMPDLQAASDTGSSSTDNVTDVTMPTFIVTGVESQSTVRLISSVDNVIGTVTVPGGQLTCTITPTTALTHGAHVITATQTDQAGNVSAASPAMAPNLYIAVSPTVTTQAVTDITSLTATGHGNIVSLGIPSPKAHGMVWNTTGSPTLADSSTNGGAASTAGPFTGALTGLNPNTTYYVRAYATNDLTTVYGDQVTFASLGSYTIAITSEHGTVVKAPDQPAYDHGTSVVLTATPTTGYAFVNWTGSVTSTDNPLTVTMDGNKTFQANYVLNTFTISGTVTVGSTGLSGVTMSGLPNSPVTDASGHYTATVNYGFTGMVTPTHTAYTFDPASKTYTNVTANTSGENYSASLIVTTQRQALIALYNSTGGDSWSNNSGWKTPPLYPDGFAMPGTEGGWYGLGVDGSSNVTSIDLYNNNLNGSIPAALGGLTSLTFLRLGSNPLLTGTIPPALGGLSNLTSIYLDGTQIGGTIPPELGSLINLGNLYLSTGLFSGSIPSELGNLSNLVYLSLRGNQLTGPIPASLGKLTNLQMLNLEMNQLSGSIPADLGKLTQLQTLSLWQNQLSGSIPPELGDLHSLTELYLQMNGLTGSIPAKLGDLINLQTLGANHNELTGPIPSSLGGMTSLRNLDFAYNHLTGTIPLQLASLANLQTLDLQANQLSGSIPTELGNLTSLITLTLNSNQLSGTIPSSLAALANLTTLRLGFNSLTASNPDLIAFLNAKNPGWDTTQTIAPTQITATAVEGANILVSWLPITFSGDPGYYKVYVSQTSGSGYALAGQTANKTVTSVQVNGLTPGVTYYFVVQTHTDSHPNNQSALESDYSTEASATAWTQLNIHISGTVTLGASPLAGVVMNGLPGSPVTDASGFYSGTVAAGSTLTVTPTLAGYMFAPVSIPYSHIVADQTAQNYTATPVVVPTITVTSPNGGERWAMGSAHAVTWTQTGLTGTVTIDLYKGGVYQKTLGTGDAAAGTFSWTIASTETAGTDYMVRVWQSGTASDDSDADFSIVRTVRVDFNKDGQEDLLWRYYGAGGYNRVWFLGTSGDATQPLILGGSQINSASAPAQMPKARVSRPILSDPREIGVVQDPKANLKVEDVQAVMSVRSGRKTSTAAVSDPRYAGRLGSLPMTPANPASVADPTQAKLILGATTSSGNRASITSTKTWLGGADLLTVDDLNWKVRGTGDFNGDGNVDILWRYEGPGGANVIWFMNGTDWIGSAELIPVDDLNWQIVGTGDFNKDGHMDILWRYNGVGGYNVVWFMNGAEWIGSTELITVSDLNWMIVGTGDFNRDGNVDILWRYGEGPGFVYVWYMNGTNWIGGGDLISVADQAWQIMGTGDYNNDGNIDILWRYNGAGGAVYIWYLNGVQWIGGEDLLPVGDLNWKIVSR